MPTLLTSYGSVYGAVPFNTGRVFYVAPGAAGGGTANTATYQVNGQSYGASDGNDGLDPRRALASLNQALTLVGVATSPSSPSSGTTASAGTFDDVIVLLPGLHNIDANVSAVPTISNGRVLITGVHGAADPSILGEFPVYALRTQVQSSSAQNLLSINANDVEIAFLQFNGKTAKSSISFGATSKRVRIVNCVFNMYGVAASTSTKCIAGNSQTLQFIDIVRNTFLTDAAQGPWIDFTGTTATDINIVQNNMVHQTGTLAVGVQAAAGLDRMVYQQNNHLCGGGGTVTVGFDGTNSSISGGVLAINNMFASQGYTATTCFKNWGATNTKLMMILNTFAQQSSGTATAPIQVNIVTAT